MARVFPFACPTRASWEGSMCVMDWGFPLRTSRSQCCRDSISVSQALCILGMTHWGIQQQIKKTNSRHPADSSDHLRFAKKCNFFLLERRVPGRAYKNAFPILARLPLQQSGRIPENPASSVAGVAHHNVGTTFGEKDDVKDASPQTQVFLS